MTHRNLRNDPRHYTTGYEKQDSKGNDYGKSISNDEI
jgi:hypothetical protein